MTNPLESSYLKLGRATEHLEQLDTEVRAFVNSQPYGVIPHWDFDAPEHTMRVRTVVEPPAHLGLICGDVLHNLRSSLDHLIYELAGIGKDKRGEHTQWPVCDTPDLFKERSRSYLKGVDTVHWAAIKRAQPYNPGYRLFSQLALLDDRDKHRLVQPIVSSAVNATMRADPPDAISAVRIPNTTVYLDDKTVLCWFRAKEEVPVHYELGYTIKFGSRDGPHVAISDLFALVGLTSAAISRFIGAFD